MSADPVGQGLGLPTLVHTIAEPVESRLVGLAERYLITYENTQTWNERTGSLILANSAPDGSSRDTNRLLK